MSEVVHLTRPTPYTAVVELADRENSNQFSKQLVEQLLNCFQSFESDKALRAVVVHGYDTVFCTGGTQEELLDVLDGRIKFNDVPLYRLFLDCPVPVLAAMQGHALGGGLIMGLFADIVILAEESLYSANFMKYGFTPGMGATLVLPEKLGSALATEMLFTAGGYHGGQLRERGVSFPVCRRAEVIPTAMHIATQIAEKPEISLKLLKKRMTARLVQQLPQTIQEELRMHEQSFAQPEVRQRIERLFGE